MHKYAWVIGVLDLCTPGKVLKGLKTFKSRSISEKSFQNIGGLTKLKNNLFIFPEALLHQKEAINEDEHVFKNIRSPQNRKKITCLKITCIVLGGADSFNDLQLFLPILLAAIFSPNLYSYAPQTLASSPFPNKLNSLSLFCR